MRQTNRHVAGAVAAITIVFCACLAGTALASSAARHHKAHCSLPNGGEGGVPLPFLARNVTCKKARPVVKAATHFSVHGRSCNIGRAGGCEIRRYRCRDIRQENPGYLDPGDTVRCTQGLKAIRFEEPG